MLTPGAYVKCASDQLLSRGIISSHKRSTRNISSATAWKRKIWWQDVQTFAAFVIRRCTNSMIITRLRRSTTRSRKSSRTIGCRSAWSTLRSRRSDREGFAKVKPSDLMITLSWILSSRSLLGVQTFVVRCCTERATIARLWRNGDVWSKYYRSMLIILRSTISGRDGFDKGKASDLMITLVDLIADLVHKILSVLAIYVGF